MHTGQRNWIRNPIGPGGSCQLSNRHSIGRPFRGIIKLDCRSSITIWKSVSMRASGTTETSTKLTTISTGLSYWTMGVYIQHFTRAITIQKHLKDRNSFRHDQNPESRCYQATALSVFLSGLHYAASRHFFKCFHPWARLFIHSSTPEIQAWLPTKIGQINTNLLTKRLQKISHVSVGSSGLFRLTLNKLGGTVYRHWFRASVGKWVIDFRSFGLSIRW